MANNLGQQEEIVLRKYVIEQVIDHFKGRDVSIEEFTNYFELIYNKIKDGNN